MRLHRLRLAAFGPYAAEQVVDFDRLAHGGLFLLEGPTGAGKSTILDAVTFALYGGLAGEDPAEDRLRSHFAAAEARTEVELVWSLRGVRYKVTRGPEYRRPKRRGDGFTTEASRVHLQRRDGEAWASLSANKAEAGELIAELVGLTRAQFTQVMLLPQGEFARFLRSSDDLRRGLLSKLFGTSLYDRITEDLCARRTEAARARDQAGRAISIAVSAAAEAAGLDAGESAELLAAARAERQTQLKELDESLAQAIAATGAALAAAAGSLSAAQAEEEEARRQAGLMTRLTTALADLRAHQGTRPGHDERAARLALARHAEPVRPLLEVLAEAVAAVEAATGDLADLLPEPDEAGLADRDGAAAAARAEAAEAEAAGLQHGAEAEQGLLGREAELGRLEQAAAGAEERVAALERARQEFPDRVTTLETRLAEAGAMAAGLGTAAQQLGAVRRRGDAAALLAGLEPRLAGLNAARVAAIEAHHRLVDEHQHLLDARLAGIAAELAAALAEGGPCPVCGSPAHPSPALACASAVSAEEVEEARQRRESADAERDRAEREHAALAIEAAGCEAMSGGQSVAALAAEADALARQVAQAEAAAQEAAGLEREIADARAEQEHVGTELREAAEAAAAARAQAGRAAADLAVLRAEVRDAAQGHESVAARQAALRSAAVRDRALAAALDRVTACAAAEAAARARAAAEAQAQGFATADAAAQAVLTSQGQAALAAEVRSWEERLGLLTAAAQAPDLAGLDPGGAQQATARAAEAAAALARARDAERAAREASLGAARRAERFAQRSGDVRAVEDDYDRVAEATEAVVRLASLANGTEGHRRVALTTYVLRHWFGQVVAAANARLSAMSSGRYELRRTDEGKTRRDRSGLTLAVIDRHTGEERSPASLSGGETFYTSLALALGLADMVRAEAGGVDLDTLFIDEGFGSLDSGTLDQVMGVIDELRDRGRVIGIVSHVADLKERVPERLEVRRLPDGSSAVRVVA
jgi:DNA repair protein SbcC/Rad50